MEHADMNPCRPHALRSAFSTILRLNGFDPMLVEFMQGHSVPYNGAYLIPPEEKVSQMYAEIETTTEYFRYFSSRKKLDERLKAYRDDITNLQEENKELKQRLNKVEEELKAANNHSKTCTTLKPQTILRTCKTNEAVPQFFD